MRWLCGMLFGSNINIDFFFHVLDSDWFASLIRCPEKLGWHPTRGGLGLSSRVCLFIIPQSFSSQEELLRMELEKKVFPPPFHTAVDRNYRSKTWPSKRQQSRQHTQVKTIHGGPAEFGLLSLEKAPPVVVFSLFLHFLQNPYVTLEWSISFALFSAHFLAVQIDMKLGHFDSTWIVFGGARARFKIAKHLTFFPQFVGNFCSTFKSNPFEIQSPIQGLIKWMTIGCVITGLLWKIPSIVVAGRNEIHPPDDNFRPPESYTFMYCQTRNVHQPGRERGNTVKRHNVFFFLRQLDTHTHGPDVSMVT